MKILIVDDSATIRNILKVILEESGHTVEEVTGGEAAIEMYLNKKPDLILMDVEMEGLSGYETAKRIKALHKKNNIQKADDPSKKDETKTDSAKVNESKIDSAKANTQTNDTAVTTNIDTQSLIEDRQKQEDWVPIVFLSAHSDEKSLSEGIESGGDDYLFKPFSKVVLNAKIKAMERICDMRKAIIAQKELVDKMNSELIEEQTVAKNIYDNIVQNGVITKHDFINTYVSSKGVFNGDLALTAKSSSGNYYIIIGDFTGHGLSAALGIIPAAELFLKLTLKGFTLEQLLIELNCKLHNILPTNIFCAAAVLEVDLDNRLLSVWNGWSPEVLCFSKDGQLKKSFASTNMPLGLLKKEKFNCKLTLLELQPGDKIYIYSDGFNETKNITGNMFGIEGVKSSIVKGLQGNFSTIDTIIKDVTDFRGNLPQQDDLTLIEISMKNDNVN